MTTQLRFPEFTDEWQVKKLGESLKSISSGKSKTMTDGNKYPIYGSTGKIGKSDNYDYSGDKLLIARVGANAGSMYRVSGSYKVSDNTLIVNLNNDVDTAFVQYSLINFNINRLVFGSGQPLVTGGMLKNTKLALPSRPEQEKIADFLTAVDERIRLGEQKLAKLEQYKRGVMQQIFSQKIRFKDENGNEYPVWEEKKLGDIAKKENSPISANEIVGRSGKYKVYGASGLLQTLDSYKQGESYTAIVKDGAGVGRLMWCEAESSVLGTLNIIKPKLDVSSKFLHYLLHTINFQRYSIGSTIPHVYFSDYSKHKLVVPENIEEQQKIATFLTTLDDKITVEKSKLAAARKFKKALLQRMFV